jgi:hypothetical protein
MSNKVPSDTMAEFVLERNVNCWVPGIVVSDCKKQIIESWLRNTYWKQIIGVVGS